MAIKTYTIKDKQRIINQLQQLDVGYIKHEFEGNSDYSDSCCDSCDGEGSIICGNCEGDGTVLVFNDATSCEDSEDCIECDGTGYITCDDCGGRTSDYSLEDLEYELQSSVNRDALTYLSCYYDGSVNTECTTTAPLTLDGLEALETVEREFNSRMNDFDNAGIHISLLPKTSNGCYPCFAAVFDSDRIANFTREVTKLLPSLYLLASRGSSTRTLNYRLPKISDDKYSAIHLCTDYDGVFAVEFRIFDPNGADMFWHNLEVIAKAWQYYSTNKRVTGSNYKLQLTDTGYSLSLSRDMYGQSYSAYRALRDTIRYVKPDNVSVKQLFEHYDIQSLDTKQLRQRDSVERKKLYAKYTAYVNEMHASICEPLSDVETYELQRLKTFLQNQHGIACDDTSLMRRFRRTASDILSFDQWAARNCIVPSSCYLI